MPSFQLSPGVVIDSDRGEAYVMAPEGEIVAVDLAAGTPVWRSNKAAKPLAVSGTILVGQAEPAGPGNALQIVSLNTSRGGAPVAQSLVQLPPNVHPMIDQAAHRAFTARAQPQDDEARVSWEFVERPLRGVAPAPPQVLPGEAPPAGPPMTPPGAPPALATVMPAAVPGPQPTLTRGSVRINLSSGAVAADVAPHFAVPTAAALAAPIAAPDLPPDRALPGIPQPQFLSADGQHVLVSRRIAEDPAREKYSWTIFERQTGRPLGEFRAHLRYAPFFVAGNRAIYQTPPATHRDGERLVDEPPQIQAVDLATGARLWTQPVRDTVDRRPRPP